jgi:hypothetical protein
MAKVSLNRSFTHPFDFGGATVPVTFKRMLVDPFIEWEKQFLHYGESTGAEVEGRAAVAKADEMQAWIKQSLADHVSIAAGELEVDGEPVRAGADIWKFFGMNLALMLGLMSAIWAHHRFEEEMRKKLLSPSGSETISSGPAKEAAGQTPEATAASAGQPDTATTEAAGPAAQGASSGATAE